MTSQWWHHDVRTEGHICTSSPLTKDGHICPSIPVRVKDGNLLRLIFPNRVTSYYSIHSDVIVMYCSTFTKNKTIVVGLNESYEYKKKCFNIGFKYTIGMWIPYF